MSAERTNENDYIEIKQCGICAALGHTSDEHQPQNEPDQSDLTALDDLIAEWWRTCETPTVYHDGEHLASTLLAETILGSPEFAAIVAGQTAAAISETVARLEAVTPREAMRPNERRTYWQGVRDALSVVRGQRDALVLPPEPRSAT